APAPSPSPAPSTPASGGCAEIPLRTGAARGCPRAPPAPSGRRPRAGRPRPPRPPKWYTRWYRCPGRPPPMPCRGQRPRRPLPTALAPQGAPAPSLGSSWLDGGPGPHDLTQNPVDKLAGLRVAVPLGQLHRLVDGHAVGDVFPM